MPRLPAGPEAGTTAPAPGRWGAFQHGTPGKAGILQMAGVIPVYHVQFTVLPLQQGNGGVGAGGCLAQLFQGIALYRGQQDADGAAVGEDRHGAAVVFRRDLLYGVEHPVPDLGGSLRPLRVPQVQPVGEIFHLLRICPGDLPQVFCSHTPTQISRRSRHRWRGSFLGM